MNPATTDAPADAGLTHEDYKARGESGEYRPDLDRYFLLGMRQPPLPSGDSGNVPGPTTMLATDVAAPVAPVSMPAVAPIPAADNPPADKAAKAAHSVADTSAKTNKDK